MEKSRWAGRNCRWGHIFKGCSLRKGSANLYFCCLFPVWGHTFFFFLIDTGIQDWTLNCNCLKIVLTVHLEYTANEPLLFLLQLSALVCPPAACSYLLLWKAAYLHRTVPASFLFCVILCCFRIICLWALSLWCLPAFFFFFVRHPLS